MAQDELAEDRLSELEKRTVELEEHKVRVDEQTDQLRTMMLRMSARVTRVWRNRVTASAPRDD